MFFTWVVLSKLMVSLPFLNLRSPFEKKFMKLRQLSVSFSGRYRAFFLVTHLTCFAYPFTCCFYKTCVLFLLCPPLHAVEHGHEITRSRGSKECLTISDNWKLFLARKYLPKKLNGSARDIVLVCQCHRIPHFRDLGRPRRVCNGVVTSYAQYRV